MAMGVVTCDEPQPAASNAALNRLRACLKTPAPRRVRARGLQETAEIAMRCSPGALAGRVFKQALRLSAGFISMRMRERTEPYISSCCIATPPAGRAGRAGGFKQFSRVGKGVCPIGGALGPGRLQRRLCARPRPGSGGPCYPYLRAIRVYAALHRIFESALVRGLRGQFRSFFLDA